MATLLIIEDDQAINGLMARTLSITGHQCLTAYTGSEAISMIKEQAVDLQRTISSSPSISRNWFHGSMWCCAAIRGKMFSASAR